MIINNYQKKRDSYKYKNNLNVFDYISNNSKKILKKKGLLYKIGIKYNNEDILMVV